MKFTAAILAGLVLRVSGTPVDSDSSVSATAADLGSSNIKIPSEVHNANHILNALHSSMRQWGSAWNHNGMSFFLASVPAGTQFYHGTSSASPINGTEWLAFEPEHALGFARVRRPRGSPGKGPHGPPPTKMTGLVEDTLQNVLHDSTADEEDKWGYLHTYSAAKDLRLLYIDGLSAGKTDMGTTDSQDRILLRDNIASSSNMDAMMPPPEYSNGKDEVSQKRASGPPGEYERAVQGCAVAKNDWNDRIDGFLRAEAGFEIILCDFARDLDLVRISAVHREDEEQRGFGASGYFYKSIASRFNNIGGNRVTVNYNHFVTAFSHKELDL